MISPDKRSIWAWALYDWANSAFSLVVMAGFFPLVFKQYWSQGVTATQSTYHLGLINSVASMVVVILSPLLGAIADKLGFRKGLLMLFACLGAVMTSALYWVEQGEWQYAALIYAFAVIGFSGSNLFYDALLTVVSPAQWLHRVSALGFGLGYLGGGLLFALNIWMSLSPDTFGMANRTEAIRFAFLLTAFWWLFFSIPLVLFVEEPSISRTGLLQAASSGVQQLYLTFRKIPSLPQTFKFLLAYWLYIDGVATIIRMAVDYGLAIGLNSIDLITALLVTQFVGFPAAILFGRIGEQLGPKQSILLALGVYILITLYSATMHSAWQFYLLAVSIGLIQGGVQSLSRSLYARLVPLGSISEFFGFYNMMGKFAAVLGPLLVGWVTLVTDNNRIGVLSILILFIAGGYLLFRVDTGAGQQQAKNYR